MRHIKFEKNAGTYEPNTLFKFNKKILAGKSYVSKGCENKTIYHRKNE